MNAASTNVNARDANLRRFATLSANARRMAVQATAFPDTFYPRELEMALNAPADVALLARRAIRDERELALANAHDECAAAGAHHAFAELRRAGAVELERNYPYGFALVWWAREAAAATVDDDTLTAAEVRYCAWRCAGGEFAVAVAEARPRATALFVRGGVRGGARARCAGGWAAGAGTLLALAAAHSSLGAVRALLAEHVEPTGEALRSAAQRGDAAVVRVLLAAGAPVEGDADDGPDDDESALGCTSGETPLMAAASGGHRAAMRALLAAGADAAPHAARVDSPLCRAAQCGRGVGLLLAHGADARRPGEHALHAAAKCGRAPALRLLLSAGADVHARCDAGETALHAAARWNHATVVRALLAVGARVDALDSARRRSPLMAAAEFGSVAAVHALLAAGARPTQRSATGTSALLLAATRGCTRGVRALLAAGADVDAADSWGLTPLMAAAWAWHASSVAQLLRADAAVNCVHRSARQTALLLTVACLVQPLAQNASKRGALEVVRQLVSRGASHRVADCTGRTPLDYVRAAQRDRRCTEPHVVDELARVLQQVAERRLTASVAIGLAALNFPVLVVAQIVEHLIASPVSPRTSELERWNICTLIKFHQF